MADLSLAYSDGTVRITPTQNLVFRWVKRDDAHGALRAAGGGGARSRRCRHDRGHHELPGRRVVQARGDAVARARPVSHGLRARESGADRAGADARRQGQRLSERLRPASHRGGRVPGQPPQGRRPRRCRSTSSWSAAASTATGATFGRLVAKIPARRAAVALDRLARLYAAEHRERRERPPRSSTAWTSSRSRSCSRISSRCRRRPRRRTISSIWRRRRSSGRRRPKGECAV